MLQNQEILETFGWNVLSRFIPDGAPLDYHLFRLMSHGLSESTSVISKISKNGLIASKESEFFYHGIHLLSEKWEKVIAFDR